MNNNILVIGGTGKTGRKIVQRLEALNVPVRAGSRNGQPPFDWSDSSTWPAALRGMDKAYITYQPDLAVPGALDAIEELTGLAKTAGVRKLVLLSGKGEREAELCEQVIINSGLDHTIIRASWFNQNFSESFFLEPILAGHVALPEPGARIPFIDTGDIADVAVEVLLNDKHIGRIYELTGPARWTFEEVVREIAGATGRKIRFAPITHTAYAEMLEKQGLPADFVWLIGYLFRELLNKPGNNMVTDDVERVLGRPARDFTEYVRETASTGVWNAPAAIPSR